MPIPLFVKVLHTLFTAVLVPVYWVHYGPSNFLWFSDIALFLSVVALWMQSPLLASMQALSVALLELVWIGDFLGQLLFGVRLTGLSDYMFDPALPLSLRAISLFHLWLPFLLLWMVYEYGYDPRALPAQTALCWIVLLACYFFTDPSKNINWVFGLGNQPQQTIPSWLYLMVAMIVYPVAVYLPTHLLLKWLMPRA